MERDDEDHAVVRSKGNPFDLSSFNLRQFESSSFRDT